VCFRERQWHREWQWLGGSGTVGKRRSGRFEWYWIECGSGSIGRAAVAFVENWRSMGGSGDLRLDNYQFYTISNR
jgi:hypothetical protein